MLRRGIVFGLLSMVIAAVSGGAITSASKAKPAGSGLARQHWIGAWEAAPSDASSGNGIEDQFAASEVPGPGDKKLPVNDSTVRAILTPTYGGSTLRIHLSNRFGTAPVTFNHVTLGRQASGATLVGTPVELRFDGAGSVTVPAGRDVVSDPVGFSFSAFQTLAVSIFVSGDAGMPTEHYTARQTSYLTPDGSGDHAADTDGTAFALSNSTRPYVDGVDVLAPGAAGAVVAFGDSITDGFQGEPGGVPGNPQGLDQNRRWPDDLARRLIAAHIPLSVLNAGISGNRVLLNGTDGGGPDEFGPSALTRLQADVLRQSGVTTVIWLEGINDLGQTPTATVPALENGWRKGIAVMHAAGLRVLQGTLTPSGTATGSEASYGTAATEQAREALNAWIRTQSPADAVIDFDAAVRDPANHADLNPAYDGSDGLHLNPAGYQAMADAIKLSLLRSPSSSLPTLRVHLTPRVLIAGRRTTLRVLVTSAAGPVRGALVRGGGRRTRTNVHGLALLVLRPVHPGELLLRVSAARYRPAALLVRVRPSATHRRS